MTEPVTVSQLPPRPLLIFDGDCTFCRYWVHRWMSLTAGAVDSIPFQDPGVAARFPELPRSQFETAVQLIEPDGRVYSAAEAAFRCLATNRSFRWLLWIYGEMPGARQITEWAYRLVARHRMTFSMVTTLLFGTKPETPRHELVRALFLRGLGFIYLVAFLSLWSQLGGLIGRHGILPAADYMARAREYFDQAHVVVLRYYQLPTWCWLSASDWALQCLCGLGTMASICLVARVAPMVCCVILWSVYLSLSVVGQEFFAFQWDGLLLEAGFLAIFLAPAHWWPSRRDPSPTPRAIVWLLRWLIFRLMFESGSVKLLSGDPAWHNLTALNYHYETQPLPTALAWHLHQLPARFHEACVGSLFGVELGLPLLALGPRRLRAIAAAGFVILQVWILCTGNYGFFNYLTILLCIPLLDDSMLERALPRVRYRSAGASRDPAGTATSALADEPVLCAHAQPRAALARWRVPKAVMISLTAFILLVTGGQIVALFPVPLSCAELARATGTWLAPFRSFNSYGLFAVMTTTRPEIVIEGSKDGLEWLPYEFKFKPGSLQRPPRLVAPHQPRLDWQMWFAALGTPQQNPWFVRFCIRLLEGSPEVTRLLAVNPFPDAPPRLVRAVLYRYQFTTRGARDRSGNWWERERLGLYLQPISFRDRPSSP